MIMAPSWVSKGAPFQGTLFRKTSRGSPLHYPSLGSLKEKLKRTNLFQQKSRKVITYLTWVKVVLPYCYLIVTLFSLDSHFFTKPWKPLGPSARPRNGGLARTSKGPVGSTVGSTVPRREEDFLALPTGQPWQFQRTTHFSADFSWPGWSFEKSADSEAFGGDLWIPLDSWNSGPRGRHYQNYPNHPQVYRVLETNWSKCPKN